MKITGRDKNKCLKKSVWKLDTYQVDSKQKSMPSAMRNYRNMMEKEVDLQLKMAILFTEI